MLFYFIEIYSTIFIFQGMDVFRGKGISSIAIYFIYTVNEVLFASVPYRIIESFAKRFLVDSLPECTQNIKLAND